MHLSPLPGPAFNFSVIYFAGVCPAEALRIRMVANAESFQDTLTGAVEQEGGIPSLWDGFPPLLVRQVNLSHAAPIPILT